MNKLYKKLYYIFQYDFDKIHPEIKDKLITYGRCSKRTATNLAKLYLINFISCKSDHSELYFNTQYFNKYLELINSGLEILETDYYKYKNGEFKSNLKRIEKLLNQIDSFSRNKIMKEKRYKKLKEDNKFSDRFYKDIKYCIKNGIFINDILVDIKCYNKNVLLEKYKNCKLLNNIIISNFIESYEKVINFNLESRPVPPSLFRYKSHRKLDITYCNAPRRQIYNFDDLYIFFLAETVEDEKLKKILKSIHKLDYFQEKFTIKLLTVINVSELIEKLSPILIECLTELEEEFNIKLL